MDIEALRGLCLSFPGAAEQIQWGNDLVFKVAGNMFAVAALEPASVFLSFKASPENFAALTERLGIIPAPYLARAQWVALQTRDALSREELASLLRESYDLVAAKLPHKVKESLAKPSPRARTAKSSRRRAAKRRRAKK